MELVIIGSGNVATVMGRKFLEADHRILQVISRNESAAGNLALEWNTESINFSGKIYPDAEVYLIAVSDDGIKDVINLIKLSGKVVAHTAASVSKEILQPVSDHYGVFYPLQTLRKEIPEIPEIPILYDGNDELTKIKLESLAVSISPGYVSQAGDELRSKLHLAAVFASNFTNHLYALAAEYCNKEGINFKKLQPLIEETAARLKFISPQNAQTGPALRNDEETIRKQLVLLAAYPELKKIYEYITDSIRNYRKE